MAAAIAFAGTIDTTFLEQPWPKQWARDYEVGRYQVHWRQRAAKQDGLFAGVAFTAPLPRAQLWQRTMDFTEIGRITPGVVAVRTVEQTAERQVIEMEIEVFWKKLALRFEIEQEPPRTIRFRLLNDVLGEYRGVCHFEELPTTPARRTPATAVEVATWLKPARPMPQGALLLLERMTMLRGVRNFLEACEQPTAISNPSIPSSAHPRRVASQRGA